MSFLSSVVASVPLDLDFLSFVTDINNGIVSQQEVKKLSFLRVWAEPTKRVAHLSKLCLRHYCEAVTNVPLDRIFLSFVVGKCNRIVPHPVIP